MDNNELLLKNGDVVSMEKKETIKAIDIPIILFEEISRALGTGDSRRIGTKAESILLLNLILIIKTLASGAPSV